MRHEHDDDELLSDENDVTIQQSSFHAEPSSISSDHTPLSVRFNTLQRKRSNSEGYNLKDLSSNQSADSKSLK
jgi:hypothetical protein